MLMIMFATYSSIFSSRVARVFAGLFVVLSAGCGEPGTAPGVEAPPADEPVTSLVITGNDRMRFDQTRFVVRAGDEIELTFRNIGRMPKETMGHNLAILQRGVVVNDFAMAAVAHPENAYIPPQYEDQVIATTAILGPGEEETLVFTAPEEPGEYPFVCSFPGHTMAGMQGIMVVIQGEN